ncbi:YesN/AraC family two-component response regulator [Bacillus thermophilus]|uniref:YesN/AraC family two-component response regulator n=1 Tax=Siminovitchia thermophila TaxID=1245522 RepID=A0ABS2R7U8_9BACI|nr:helix-turn-helix domain-containing protein [Siminovitchia thermophila]MBM7715718.1 YesN/AraC family two-component response regulator [Siminovitchia thermophila]ONK21309.1 DNA-binding response regulator [Bacillus sp. VT-16-64]
MNILVLDDEPIELEQLEFLVHLHYPKWSIYKALYGSEAIKLAEQMVEVEDSFQLALMDIQLPGMNGLEVATTLKSLMPNMEIIIISAFQNFDYAKRSIHLKVLDYIVKPVIEKELVAALRNFLKTRPEYDNCSDIVRAVIQMVKKHYKEPLRLASIAKELHINVSYLSRLFREEVGINFSDYLLHFRIENAKKMLIQNKNWTILRVAEECGFNSQHYFSSAFKKMVSCTPKEYRNKKVV